MRTALGVCGLALPALSLLYALTYDAWADGAWLDYARGAVLAQVVAAVAWLAVRLTIQPHVALTPVAPWVAALLVVVPGHVVHYQRTHHPYALTREQVIEDEFDAAAPSPQKWIVERRGEASVSGRAGAAIIAAPPGSSAFIDLVSPDQPSALRREFWLPRGLASATFDEALEWEASVALLNSFSVMLETRQLLVQAAPFGLHLTYPGPSGRITEHHVEIPAIAADVPHHFLLERRDGLIRLRVNDQSGWVQPDAGRFGVIRFGETRADALHGGVLTLQRVRYVRRFTDA